NIFILIDGTWNDETGAGSDGLTTNVVKLYKCLKKVPGKQSTWYFRGVGNDDENGIMGRLMGGMFGASEKNIRNFAYSTLAKEYCRGDRIFIFGFSRGAAIARLLAGQIHERGIPASIEITTDAQENKGTNHIETRYVSHKATSPELVHPNVEFLGVWDTVVAMGVKGMFKNFSVAPNVQKAVHLVAIDETRTLFNPTLMNHNPDVVEEIWMPGVHSDVGGSYREDVLAQHSLYCMIEKLKKRADAGGYDIWFNQEEIIQYTLPQISEEKAIFHFFGLGTLKGIRKIRALKNDKEVEANVAQPCIHQSVFVLQKSQEVYSLVDLQLEGKKEKVKTELPIIYNPPNIRKLNKHYHVDKTGYD
ncbi:MAG: DUF2235 domain-containing protein, partial [Bacteroidota bacterium]